MSAPTLGIKRAAQASGVSVHTLRYYERIGLLPAVTRDTNGQRRYSERDLAAINILLRLRHTGMSIQGMKRFAALLKRGDAAIPDRLELLEAHDAKVREQIHELEQNLVAINAKIAIYRNRQSAQRPSILAREHTRGNTTEVS